MTSLLEIDGLVKTFSVPSGMFGRRSVSAVASVTLDVAAGEVLGLVGESGSGKTTLARCVLGLTPLTAGTIRFDGADVSSLRGAERAEFRRRVQPVFQDPFASLDPRWSVGRSIREALDSYRIGTAADRDARVLSLLDRVGLGGAFAARLPRQLSGGQRQRVGIAAALASGPDLIVADEPVSALDVSVQAQILNLVADLQRDLGVAVLFVAHDLAVVEHISQRVAVMYLGQIAEIGTVGEIFGSPTHPYTRALIEAIPHPDPRHRLDHVPLSGEIPSPLDPPHGCRFHPRCPLATDACSREQPHLEPVRPAHRVACLVTAPSTPAPSN
jgi:oligopeptide/dipeptide ABC transporter ATP-binding protein